MDDGDGSTHLEKVSGVSRGMGGKSDVRIK